MRLQLSNEGIRSYIGLISHISRPWRGEGPEPEDWNKVPRIDEHSSRSLTLYVPRGMSLEEARRVTGVRACTLEMIFGDDGSQ